MKINVALALTLPLLFACSKNSPDFKQTTPQAHLSSISENSCVVAPLNGSALPEGSQAKSIHLVRQDFNGGNWLVGEQKIFGEGNFPNDYIVVKDLPSSISRQSLVAEATSWKWSLGSKQDANGSWTILTLYKEVLNDADGKSYVVDSNDFAYGVTGTVKDQNGGIGITCFLSK